MPNLKKTINQITKIKTVARVSQADFDLLKDIAPQANLWVDEVTHFFYTSLGNHPQTRDSLDHEKHTEALVNWYLALFSTATNDDSYWYEQVNNTCVHLCSHILNEFSLGVSAKIIIFYGNGRGQETSEAFTRIIQTAIGLATGECIMESA